jgi:hypothetical protein
MTSTYARRLQKDFPRLGENFQKTSCAADKYNCIAWAIGECHRPWWPGSVPEGHWPEDLPPDETVENFVAAFGGRGYQLCAGAHHEWRYQKIAIYANRRGIPTHAARQTLTGTWISKLGRNIDIRHTSLDLLEGGIYGHVVQVMKRKWTVSRLTHASILRVLTTPATTRWLRR